jgi:hypothetical protein
VAWLPRQSEPTKVFFSKRKMMLITSDMRIASTGNNHALPAPVGLAMLILLRGLTILLVDDINRID